MKARSLSFRLATFYVVVLAGSLLVLVGSFYLISIAAPLEAVRDRVRAESEALASLQRQRGNRALAEALERRAVRADERAAFHMLAAPDGSTIASNLPSWPAFSGERWLNIEADAYRDGEEDDYEALALDRRLADGTRLLVGRDVEDLGDMQEAVLNASAYLAAATLLLALVGGLLMNRAIGRRIGIIRATAHRVMEGDISGRVPLQGSGDEFDRLASTLNAMLDRIQRGNEAVRRVSDSVAHELRTPLARLEAHIARLRDSLPGERTDALNRISAEAARLNSMFDAVLRIARIEGGSHRVEFASIDLAALLYDAQDLYAPAAEGAGVTLRVDADRPLPLEVDADLLFQAICNLIDNGIKFAPEGGRVTVAGQRDGGTVILTVTDDGPGVPPEERGRLTERFFRASNSDAEGFGLGLALVDAVAQLHGSELRFEDAGPGLRVVWRLPARRG